MFDAIGHETVQRYPAVIRHWAANHPTKGISFHRSSNANPMHRFIPTLFAAMIVRPDYIAKRMKKEPVLKAKVARMRELVREFCPEMDEAFWAKVGEIERK